MPAMTFEQFFKLRNLLRAFTIRDVQTTGVLLGWVRRSGFTPEQVEMYALIAPTLGELERIGYFNKINTPEQLRGIRELEKRLPKEFRQEARKVRLNNSYTGLIGRD
jgi:hypothetical protein